MARVRLVGVSKIYQKEGGVAAVSGVDLDVAHGEFVVLVGPSGCGKSTTLRMIAGLETISSGDLFIDDRRVNDVSPDARDIAMVFQNYALYPHMTVRQNLAFALQLRKAPPAEIARRVTEAAGILGIESLLDRRPKQLSGGQRQRVAVGRAIVREPRAFLFDEPLSNLDAALRVQMRREIARIHRRLAATMIYVTHDQVEAMTLGDRIVVMHGGRIMQVGTPSELYDRPANRFVAGFIGTPSMSFIEGVYDADRRTFGAAALGTVSQPMPNGIASAMSRSTTGRVHIGVRPEHVSITPPADPGHALRVTLPTDLVESIGSECYAYFVLGATHLVARCQPADAPVAGASADAWIDLRYVHCFDATNGERL